MEGIVPKLTMVSSRILTAPLFGGIVKFGMPMVAAMVLHGAFNLVDAFFIGHLDNASEPLAAINICDPILMVAMICANGISTASVAIIAHAKGQWNYDEIRKAAGQSLIIVTLMSLLFGVVGCVFARDIAVAMGATGNVLELATNYMQVMFAGSCTMIFLLQLTAILRGVGDARGPTFALILANVLNVVAAPVLIYGWEWIGIAPMGLMGAAWATIGARTVGCVLAYLWCKYGGREVLPRKGEWHCDWKMIKHTLALGIPNSTQLTVRVVSMIALIAVIAHAFTAKYGPSINAAFGLGLRIDMLAMFTAMGWGAAASTYVGQNLSAGYVPRANTAAWMACGLGVACLGFLTILAWVFAEPLVKLLADDAGPDVILYGAEYVRIVSVSYVFSAVGIVLALALNGAGSMKAPAAIDALVYGLLVVPVACLLVFAWGQDRQAVWWVIAGGNLVLAMTYIVWFRRGSWRRIKL